jgi:hypothetical protein
VPIVSRNAIVAAHQTHRKFGAISAPDREMSGVAQIVVSLIAFAATLAPMLPSR